MEPIKPIRHHNMANKPTTEDIERLAEQIADERNISGDMIRTDIYIHASERDRQEARRRLGLDQPTKEEIKEFVGIFDMLSRFEAEQYRLRSIGAINRVTTELPIKSVVKVYDWLTWKAK